MKKRSIIKGTREGRIGVRIESCRKEDEGRTGVGGDPQGGDSDVI